MPVKYHCEYIRQISVEYLINSDKLAFSSSRAANGIGQALVCWRCCDDLPVSTPEPPESPSFTESPGRPGTLESAAFGADPDLDRLPAPCSTRDWWTTAVILGGQGHYARARAALDVLDRLTTGSSTHSDRVLASLCQHEGVVSSPEWTSCTRVDVGRARTGDRRRSASRSRGCL